MKKPSKKQVLEFIKLAIADGEDRKAVTLYTENKISYPRFIDSCIKGQALKKKLDGKKTSEVTFDELQNLNKEG